jgi:hypothetical protein
MQGLEMCHDKMDNKYFVARMKLQTDFIEKNRAQFIFNNLFQWKVIVHY